MCLAVPMKIISLEDPTSGCAELDGVQYQVDLSLVPGAALGDFVIVHAGFAIEQLKEEEASERIALFQELAKVDNKQ